MEYAYHATGKYPAWWDGLRFDKPNIGWVGGDTAETIRDTTQKLLVGRIQDPDGLGSGSIPRDDIIEVKRAMGIADGLDHVKVRHVSGGTSLIFFKSYEKGRKKWQGETIDWVWFDEEPPPDIYSEGRTRTNNGQQGQRTALTFTPLSGVTEVVYQFYEEPKKFQHLTLMTIMDVNHYTDEERHQIIDSYPEHERDARVNGVPMVGEGLIFPVQDEDITVDAFPIPEHWPRIKGCDFGWDHPAANASLAFDLDSGTTYIYDVFRKSNMTVEEHASTINKIDPWIPMAWPHDGLQHDKNSGQQLYRLYADEGVNMLREKATHEDGSNGVEAGNIAILGLMKAGKWKVFSHLSDYFEEKRMYHRKDGKIVKERDDILSAVRYAWMMRRFATVDYSHWEDIERFDESRDVLTGY